MYVSISAKKSDHSKLFDSYFMSTRRTRARAAAMIANVMEQEDEERDEDAKKTTEQTEIKQEVCDEKDVAETSTAGESEIKRDFKETLNERKVFDNSTSGFNPFPDIWCLNGQELKTIEKNVPHLETGNLFNKSSKLELLKTKSVELLNEQKVKYAILEEARLKRGLEMAKKIEENQQTEVKMEGYTERGMYKYFYTAI